MSDPLPEVEGVLSIAQGGGLPPKPSRAERAIPRKSSHHFVGQLTFGEERGEGKCLGFESKLEHDLALLLIYTPGVVDVYEQVEVFYVKADGKHARHFIDYVAKEEGGRRTAVLVKPHHRAIRADFRDIAARVACAVSPRIADRVVIVTEKMLDPGRLALVAQFHACRFAQPEFDAAVLAAVERIDEPLPVRDFLRLAGTGDAGFHAAVRLVRFGRIETLQSGIVTLSSTVRRRLVH
ncbi:hypothetical protein [Pararhodobacter sp.]|uniref:hypothetical protein n=1 Tax=Pararhodobacter sp. TaxID=2127056 RepID=UPI002FDD2675